MPQPLRTVQGRLDARIIMGEDEAALLPLWREKRGEVEPEDLSGNLVVQLGNATEELNRRWRQPRHGSAQNCFGLCLGPRGLAARMNAFLAIVVSNQRRQQSGPHEAHHRVEKNGASRLKLVLQTFSYSAHFSKHALFCDLLASWVILVVSSSFSAGRRFFAFVAIVHSN
jgi:hypothetical protein